MPASQLQAIEHALLLVLVGRLILDYVPSTDPKLPTPTQYPSMTLGLNGVGLMLLLAHHWRWELLAAYIAMALFVASQHNATAGWFDQYAILRYLQIGAAIMGLLIARMLPLPDFSRLDGEYKTIGCIARRLGDVQCRVFYPSAKTRASVSPKQRLTYLHHGSELAKGLHAYKPVPMWIMGNMYNAVLAAIEDAPIAKPPTSQGWPVVFFSHGIAGSLELYSSVNQQLASAGYIVVVLNHADGSAAVACPDEESYRYYEHPPRLPNGDWDMPAAMDIRRVQLKHRVNEMHRVLDDLHALHDQAQRARDGSDKEERSTPSLFGSMDLSRVILAGHSFGGATAITTAYDDRGRKFSAAIVLDVWTDPMAPAVLKGLGDKLPVLHLVSQAFKDEVEFYPTMVNLTRGCSHPDTHLIVLQGTRHNNFSDMPSFFSSWFNRWMKIGGATDAKYALRMVGQLSTSFLKGDAFHVVRKQFPEAVDIE